MADLAAKKTRFITDTVSGAEGFLTAFRDFYNIWLEGDGCGFRTGGANALVDGDFTGANAHLDAAKFNSLLNCIDDVHKLIETGSGTQNNSASRINNIHAALP